MEGITGDPERLPPARHFAKQVLCTMWPLIQSSLQLQFCLTLQTGKLRHGEVEELANFPWLMVACLISTLWGCCTLEHSDLSLAHSRYSVDTSCYHSSAR